MPYGSPYDEEARFFREFLKMGAPISPSNLRITKEEKILLFFSPIFVIWRFNSPTGGETENIFFISVEKRLSNVQPGGEERKIIIFSQKRTKRHFIFQLGSERRKNHKFSRFGGKNGSQMSNQGVKTPNNQERRYTDEHNAYNKNERRSIRCKTLWRS